MPGILTKSSGTFSGNKFKTVLGLSPLQNHKVAASLHHNHNAYDAEHELEDDDKTDTQRAQKLVPVVAPSSKSRGRKLRAKIPQEQRQQLQQQQSEPVMPPAGDTKPAGAARPVRMDAQDGPWSVSVAEASARFFTIYVKTPTHSLTLTRSANEITEVHLKIQDQIPAGNILPPCPLESEPPQKRKSSFLTTLSRLASPPRNAHPQLTPPQEELSDPFLAAEPSVNGALSTYFTTLANDKNVRVTRSWKRFVRVRTDDLESTRVERAIKRVRSDLAAHAGNAGPLISTTAPPSHRTSTVSAHGQAIPEEGLLGAPALTPDDASADETARRLVASGMVDFSTPVLPTPAATPVVHREEPKPAAEPTPAPEPELVEPEPEVVPAAAVVEPEPTPETVEAAPEQQLEPEAEQEPKEESTPEVPAEETEEQVTAEEVVEESKSPVEEHPSRIPRSASADPDKATRLSRVWQDSPVQPVQSETEAEVTEATDAEDTDAFAGAMSDTGPGLPNGQAKPRIKKKKQKKEKKSRKVVIDDFEMMRVLGKGCAGKVLLVRHKGTSAVYALKAITKRHVLAHQELQHTMTEQAVLKRMARSNSDPFVVKLYWSFHDKENLFLVMDFHPGGDLATQLARWGRLGRDRARFYAAEIVEGCEGLHAAGVIYRDLKPENILIGGDGHIVLTDFGLSKEFPRRRPTSHVPNPHENAGGEYYASSPATPTGEKHNGLPYWMKESQSTRDLWLSTKGNDTTTTFCGTAEYLAPEVIQGLPYSYEVDWWSFGTMLYEMLTGITPFWANNHSDMYVRVLQDELTFPEDKAMDQDTKSLIRGLLQRNPALRLSEPRIKKHPYFSMIDWQHVYHKRYIPPYIPPIDPANASDTQNFDDAFLEMEPVLDTDLENDDQTGSERDKSTTDVDIAGLDEEGAPNGETSSARPRDDDVFDGYSFKARNSVLIEDDDGNEGSDESDDDAHRTTEGGTEEDLEAGQKTPEAQVKNLPQGATPASHIVEAFRKQEADRVAATSPTTAEAAPPGAVEPRDTALSEEAEPTSPQTPRNKVDELPTEHAPPTPEKDAPKPKPAPVEVAAPAVAPKKEEKKREEKEKKVVTISEKPHHKPAAASKGKKAQKQPTRRERSGVAALDRDLSDVMDEDEMPYDGEDDDWDFVEALGEEDYNGQQGKSLFARGVVDRYRLKVFRSSKTSSSASVPKAPPTLRNFSSTTGTQGSESEFGEVTGTASPTPSERKRVRGGGLSLRKPRTFLKPKSPAATYSAGSSKLSRPPLSMQQPPATISASSSGALLTPVMSTPHANGTTSLKSQPSMNSVGSPGSSDASVNGGDLNKVSLTQSAAELASSPGRNRSNKSSPDLRRQARESNPTDESRKGFKKMRKYTEQGAEKVMSLFSSPRPSPTAD